MAKYNTLPVLLVTIFALSGASGEDATISTTTESVDNTSENSTLKNDNNSASKNIIDQLYALNSTITSINLRVESLEAQIENLTNNNSQVKNNSSHIDILVKERDNIQLNSARDLEKKSHRLEIKQTNLLEKISELSKDFQQLQRKNRANSANGPEGSVIALVDIKSLRSTSNVTNDELLPEEAGNRLIENLVTNPKVTLYSRDNYTGYSEEYDFATSEVQGGCQHPKILNDVRSVNTGGKCIRLFEGARCTGWSLAIYPGSEDALKIPENKLGNVDSVGPCLPHEFQFDSEKARIIKNSSDFSTFVPDLNEFYSRRRSRGATRLPSETGPLSTSYRLGPKDRLEYVSTWIDYYANETNTMSNKTDENEFLNSLDNKPDDVLAYAIPPNFGGPALESYNVFVSTLPAREKWMELLSQAKAFIEKRKPGNVEEVQPETVIIAQKFEYDNDETTRPYAFDYHIQFRLTRSEFGVPNLSKIIYGRIFNN